MVNITPQDTWEYDYLGDTLTYRWPDDAPAGKYDLHFHYYEATGDAYFELSWAEKDDWVPYRIRPEETLSEIALATTGNVSNTSIIAERNGIADPNWIYEGQIIEVPKGDYAYNTSSELPVRFVPESSYVDSGGSATFYTDNTSSEPPIKLTPEPSYVDNGDATASTYFDSENDASPPATTSSTGDALINGAADVVTGNLFSEPTVCGVTDERDAEIVGLPSPLNPFLNAHQRSCFVHDYMMPDDKDPIKDFNDPGVIAADAVLALTSPNPAMQAAFGTKAAIGAGAAGAQAVAGAAVDGAAAIVNGTNTVLDGIATGINDLENAITSGFYLGNIF